MYKHSSVLLFAAAAAIHHVNAGLAWTVPNGITMPFAKRYSAQDLIFDLRKNRSPQYIDTVGCTGFLVNPTLYKRDVSGWDDNLDFSQLDGSTDVVAQQPTGTNPNCYSASYSSPNPLVGRGNQPPDYNNLDFINNANPFPVGGTRTDPWGDLKAPTFETNLEADNSKTGTTGAHDTPLLGQDVMGSIQTGASDVPVPPQDNSAVPGGQDIKFPSPGNDYANIPDNAAYDTTLPNQGTDISSSTPSNPSLEQQLANAQYVPSPFPPATVSPSYTLRTWRADCHM